MIILSANCFSLSSCRNRILTSLQHTERETQTNHALPVLDETHANHDGAPGDGNDRDVNAGTNFAAEDRRRRLEDDIGDEEDEGDDTLRRDKKSARSWSLKIRVAPPTQVRCIRYKPRVVVVV